MKVEQTVIRWVKDDQFGVSFLEVPQTLGRALNRCFSYSMRLSDNEEHVIPVSAFLRSDWSQRAVVSDQDSGFQQDS